MKKLLAALAVYALLVTPALAQLGPSNNLPIGPQAGTGGGGGGGGGSIVFPQTVSGTTSSGGIPYLSSGTVLSSSATLTLNGLVVGGGAGGAPTSTTTGTGVLSALGVNTGSAGAFVVNGGALGTPSSGVLSNETGLPISTGLVGFGTGVASALGANVNASGGIVSPTPASAGDVIYWNGTAWTKLAGNASGTQFLSESSAGVPSWSTTAASGVSSFSTTCPASGPSTGAVTFNTGLTVVEKTASFTAACGTAYHVVLSAAGTMTLPAAASGTLIPAVSNDNSSTNSLTIPAPSGVIDGQSSISVPPGRSVSIWSNGTDYFSDLYVAALQGPGYLPTVWYTPVGWVWAAGGAQSATVTYCTPGQIRTVLHSGGGSMTIGALGGRIATLGTSNIQFALYSNDTSVVPYRPGTLLGNTASIADTSTGAVSATVSISGITAGTYWWCSQAGDGTVRVYTRSGGNTDTVDADLIGNTTLGNIIGTNLLGGVSTPGTFGTWPSSLHGSTWTDITNQAAAISFQVSSVP